MKQRVGTIDNVNTEMRPAFPLLKVRLVQSVRRRRQFRSCKSLPAEPTTDDLGSTIRPMCQTYTKAQSFHITGLLNRLDTGFCRSEGISIRPSTIFCGDLGVS